MNVWAIWMDNASSALAVGSLPNSWKFEFDLGGVLELWPSTEYEATDNLWSLYRWSANPEDSRFVAAVQSDGALVFA